MGIPPQQAHLNLLEAHRVHTLQRSRSSRCGKEQMAILAKLRAVIGSQVTSMEENSFTLAIRNI